MNIAILSWLDPAGGAGRLAHAINQHTEHEARALSWAKFTWPWKVLHKPSEEQTVDAITWADALIIIGVRAGRRVKADVLIPPSAPRRPMVINYRGNNYNEGMEQFNAADKRDGVIQSGNFLDLNAAGGLPYWLPNPLWADEIAQYRDRYPSDRLFRVVQAVIHRSRLAVKSGPEVEWAIGGLHGVTYHSITNLSYQNALTEMGRAADIVVTSFNIGFGNAGIEGMAMGIPVIAHGPPEYIKEVQTRVGYLPFIDCSLNNLRETIEELQEKGELFEKYSDIGPHYVRKFHDPRKVAETAIDLCVLARDPT